MSYPSRRSNVIGLNGAVATSQPLAALAGMRMLLRGGNAADAAIAMAATLNVVEPMSTGLGGDAFALVYWAKERRVYALNASGRAPGRANVEAYRRRGLSRVPLRGMLAVTVPGSASGWCELLARFGTLGLDSVLVPAIAYAEQGFPVSERIAASWAHSEDVLRQQSEAARIYLAGGRAPRMGERFCNPELAQSLRLLAEGGPTHIETACPPGVVTALRARGQRVDLRDGGSYGGGQVIRIDPQSGAHIAASEPRNDGCALAW